MVTFSYQTTVQNELPWFYKDGSLPLREGSPKRSLLPEKKVHQIKNKYYGWHISAICQLPQPQPAYVGQMMVIPGACGCYMPAGHIDYPPSPSPSLYLILPVEPQMFDIKHLQPVEPQNVDYHIHHHDMIT